MKHIKWLSALLTMIFSILSFEDILDDSISMPLMMMFLGLTNFILALESFKNSQKSIGYINLCGAILIYLVMFYILLF